MNSLQVAHIAKSAALEISTPPLAEINMGAETALEERTRRGKRYLQILESGGHLGC